MKLTSAPVIGQSIVWAALLSASQAAYATLPPPPASTEKVFCGAALVVVGQASNLRLVRVWEHPSLCGPLNPSAESLDHCTAVQVTVSVEQVLYSKEPISPPTFEFRFGGGLFSVTDLRQDLLGRKRIFHVNPLPSGDGSIFETSYPWRLGADLHFVEQAKSLLSHCERQ